MEDENLFKIYICIRILDLCTIYDELKYMSDHFKASLVSLHRSRHNLYATDVSDNLKEKIIGLHQNILTSKMLSYS